MRSPHQRFVLASPAGGAHCPCAAARVDDEAAHRDDGPENLRHPPSLRHPGPAGRLEGGLRLPQRGGARRVASRPSPEMRRIVADMLRVSHNDYAEKLLWASGMKAGAARTWRGVTTYSRSQVSGYGVPLTGAVLADGARWPGSRGGWTAGNGSLKVD